MGKQFGAWYKSGVRRRSLYPVIKLYNKMPKTSGKDAVTVVTHSCVDDSEKTMT